ncbi:MAG: hypothetical protein U5O39_11850 [Gammaproteobacteria bacterium]|nr:hypothetical protein [Gammaproteobacteria bacterium]
MARAIASFAGDFEANGTAELDAGRGNELFNVFSNGDTLVYVDQQTELIVQREDGDEAVEGTAGSGILETGVAFDSGLAALVGDREQGHAGESTPDLVDVLDIENGGQG